MLPVATKSKSYFLLQGQIQGHKVIDLGVIWKGVISGVCMPKYEVSISYGATIIAKVKVDNKQTDKQTGQKTIFPRSFDPGA